MAGLGSHQPRSPAFVWARDSFTASKNWLGEIRRLGWWFQICVIFTLTLPGDDGFNLTNFAHVFFGNGWRSKNHHHQTTILFPPASFWDPASQFWGPMLFANVFKTKLGCDIGGAIWS